MNDDCPSSLVPGFLGPAPSIRERFDALGDDDMGIPTSWTPEHVQARMVEAFEVLRRSGARVGPAQFGNGWPDYLRTKAEVNDLDALANHTDEAHLDRSKPSSDEVSRMNEALRWPMDHIKGMALASDALMLWAYAKATGRDMDGMLHQRKKRATALASEMMRRANADPHLDPDGMMKDTRSPEVLARNERRRLIAVEIVDALNVRLAVVPKSEHPALVKAAHEALRNRCKAEDCLPAVYRPRDAVPGRVMARTTLDRYRKIAAAAIASRLKRAGVPVR